MHIRSAQGWSDSRINIKRYMENKGEWSHNDMLGAPARDAQLLGLTDALHAARFSCLCLSLYHLEVGWSLCPLVLFPWPRACVGTCFTIIVSCPVFRLIAL